MSRWENIWRFDTARYRVDLDVTPCEEDPRDNFEFEEDIEAIESGRVAYFDARCVVYRYDGHDPVKVGADYLGGCAYESVHDFIAGHRDKNPMNRNCSVMLAARGSNVRICNYFPGMVSEAIEEARRNGNA